MICCFGSIERRAGLTLSDSQRSWILLSWNTLSNAFQGWADQLSSAERDRLARFIIKPLQSRHRMNRYRPSIVLPRRHARARESQNRCGACAFSHAALRGAHSLPAGPTSVMSAITAAQQDVRAATRPLPYDFSYEETRGHGDWPPRSGSACC